MASTYGQPNFVPSNTRAATGVSNREVGRLGSGVLQTIEESAMAASSEFLYYGKEVGYFQLPSMQRSHGDDNRTFNVRTFNSKGTINIPRKPVHLFGPSILRFELPISYSWSGTDYTIFTYSPNRVIDINYMQLDDAVDDVAQKYLSPDYRYGCMAPHTHEYFFEAPGGPTTLPTSFQSGGMAFCFPSTIELNIGTNGSLNYDRTSNWMAIMASTPFKEMRKDLMRMSGGGLNLNDPQEAKQAPVKWGMVKMYNAAGNVTQKVPLNTRSVHNANTLATNGLTVATYEKKALLPIAWDVFLPIKTPDTNFFYALSRRKPLDVRCLSSDLQFTFTWANFYEYTDTGKGFPNAGVFNPCQTMFAADTIYSPPFAGSVVPGDGATALIANDGNAGTLVGFFQELGAPVRQFSKGITEPYLPTAIANKTVNASVDDQFIAPIIIRNPCVWTNHYRVASGRRMIAAVDTNDTVFATAFNFNQATSADVSNAQLGGRPRYPIFLKKTADDLATRLKSVQNAADDLNSNLQYPNEFTRIEWINSYLKLTNPSLGAYNALVMSKESVLYYPFQYFFSQVYRVTTNKFKNILNWNTTTITDESLNDIYKEGNKITQLIQMPANPCTSMLLGIFREKDRQTLSRNAMNSYSPVLYWNALNPEKIVLKDGGNILFQYCNSIDFEMYSIIDRPDVFKVPFRGGLVKVSRENVYGSRRLVNGGLNQGAYYAGVVADVTTPSKATSKPWWYISLEANVAGTSSQPVFGVGYQGDLHPAGSVNAFPADEFVCSVSSLGGPKMFQPCHSTEWYEASIIEFPFVMNEPIVHEMMVQSTPTFAKTQVTLDFWINPKLKPDNGMDDMYNQTYGLTRGCPSGICGTIADGSKPSDMFGSYPGPISHPVPNCLHESANPESGDLIIRSLIGSQGVGQGQTAVSNGKNEYADGFSFAQANSWNINNGDLQLVVVFCQNQIWTISPLRTSLLSARGG
jgi:hypothetical protein